jgi:predicted lipoprotein with Yx(FWY)xxD motif
VNTLIKRRSRAAWITLLGGLAAVALVVAGCGGGGSSSSGQSSSAQGGSGASSASQSRYGAPSPAPASTGPASVSLRSTKLGKILVDGQGRTLYLFQADKGTTSKCSGACTGIWPPLTTKGKPMAGSGLQAAKLGTARRSDGKLGVTYNGHPLYTYAGDSSPGQTTGEESKDFGAEWDVLSAAGDKITLDAS